MEASVEWKSIQIDKVRKLTVGYKYVSEMVHFGELNRHGLPHRNLCVIMKDKTIVWWSPTGEVRTITFEEWQRLT